MSESELGGGVAPTNIRATLHEQGHHLCGLHAARGGHHVQGTAPTLRLGVGVAGGSEGVGEVRV